MPSSSDSVKQDQLGLFGDDHSNPPIFPLDIFCSIAFIKPSPRLSYNSNPSLFNPRNLAWYLVTGKVGSKYRMVSFPLCILPAKACEIYPP